MPSYITMQAGLSVFVIHGKNYSIDIPNKVYDVSWSSVQRLEVSGSQKNFTLPYNFTKTLHNLTLLRLRNSNLTGIERSALSNIKSIEELDLSNNSFLHITEVENGLENFQTNTLKIFNISAIHNAENMLQFALTEKLFYPLSSVQILDMSWIRASQIHASFGLMPNLISLNISGTLILGPVECFSTIIRLHRLELLALDHWPTLARNGEVPSLQYDLHIATKREIRKCPPTPYTDTESGCMILQPSLKHLYLRYVHSSSFFLSVEKGFCLKNNSVQFFSIRHMKIFKPISALLGFHELKFFDMSFLGYHFKTNALWDMPVLETFLSPGNNLKALENDPDFGTVFKNNRHLRVVDLSENELSHLPPDLFFNNPSLEIVNLSTNILQYIHVNLSQCVQLKYLILKHNLLKTIDGMLMSYLDYLFHHKDKNVTLDVSENVFSCTCDNLNFITWFHITNVTIVNKLSLSCKDSNSVSKRMLTLDVAQMEETCVPDGGQPNTDALTFSLVGVFAGLTVIVLLLTVICIFRRRKFCIKDRGEISAEPSAAVGDLFDQSTASLQEVRTLDTNDHFVLVAKDRSCTISRKPKYTVFLAYCHEDRDFVVNKLYSPLEKCLREYLPDKNKDTLTLLYDKNFLPGEDIIDICRAAVYQSYVTVAIVSENFLKSRWCSYEMKTAVEFDIPFIPLYLTKCQEEDLSGILRFVYEHKVRLLWPQTGLDTCSVSEEEMDLIRCLANSVATYVRKHDSEVFTQQTHNVAVTSE